MSLNNPFIRAVGITAIAWILLQGLTYILDALVKLMSSLAVWTRVFFVPHSIQLAIGIGIVYLIYTAVTTSRD